MLIDNVLARPAWAASYSARVQAPPDRTFAAIRDADFGSSWIVRALLAVRGLRSPLRTERLTLGMFEPRGFVVLQEAAPREIVLGLVGRFWTFNGGVRHVAAADFAGFDEPGHAKVAWNFSIEPDGDGCVVRTETRIVATDDSAALRFSRYWLLIKPFSGVIRREMLAAIKREAERTT